MVAHKDFNISNASTSHDLRPGSPSRFSASRPVVLTPYAVSSMDGPSKQQPPSPGEHRGPPTAGLPRLGTASNGKGRTGAGNKTGSATTPFGALRSTRAGMWLRQPAFN